LPQGSLTANGPFCASGSGQLIWTATAGAGIYTVIYNDGIANRTVAGVTSGTAFPVEINPVASSTTYTLVSVQDANCIRSSGFTGGNAVITVNPSPSPTFSTSPTGDACAKDDVTYTTQSGQINYVWNVPGNSGTDYSITSGGIGSTSNTVTIKWLTAGSKTVTVNYTDGNGCVGTSASSTVTVHALPSIGNFN